MDYHLRNGGGLSPHLSPGYPGLWAMPQIHLSNYCTKHTTLRCGHHRTRPAPIRIHGHRVIRRTHIEQATVHIELCCRGVHVIRNGRSNSARQTAVRRRGGQLHRDRHFFVTTVAANLTTYLQTILSTDPPRERVS